MYPARLLLLLGALALAAPAAAQPAAQAIRVTVLDAATGDPLAGALVAAAGSDSLWSAAGLTSASGTRLVPIGQPGRVRVRVRRIGFAPWTSAVVDVPAGRTVPLTARVDAAPVRLATIDVRSAGACLRRPEPGSPVGLLWEEVRKALETSAIVSTEGGVPLLVTQTARTLNLRGAVEREQTTPAVITRERPFRSRPARELSATGWAQRDADGTLRFDAPDEASLLSREFEAEHCFEVSRTRRGGEVGLSFAPVPERTLPDIAGTIWMDSATAVLRRIEFTYRNIPTTAAGTLGGEVRFARLDDGRWIVPAWRIRMPRLAAAAAGGPPELTGFLEQGGTTAVADAEQARALGARVGSLEGLLFDSLTNRPLGDAVVRVGAGGFTVRSDPAGWFALELLPAGDVALRVEHPQLDSLATSLDVRVRIDSGRTGQVVLATPSLATWRQRTCPDTLGRGRDVLVLGRVRDAATGAAIDKAGALLKWFESGKSARGFFEVKGREAAAFTDAAGRFAGCVPREQPFSIAGVAETMSGEIEVAGTTAPFIGVELWVDRDSTASRRGVLRGVVRDSAGRAIFGAMVALDGVQDVARSDSTGAFTLRGVPVGSRMIDVRRLGYAAARQGVVIRPGDTDPVAIVLSPAQTLAARRITGQRALTAKLQGFEERRRLGFGTFFDANQLEFYKNTTVASIVRRVPSIYVQRIPPDQRVVDGDGSPLPPNSEVITMSSAGRGYCVANVFVDGRVVSQQEFWSYRPEDFIGVEVYPRASLAPAAFGNLRNGCGVVSAWTK